MNSILKSNIIYVIILLLTISSFQSCFLEKTDKKLDEDIVFPSASTIMGEGKDCFYIYCFGDVSSAVAIGIKNFSKHVVYVDEIFIPSLYNKFEKKKEIYIDGIKFEYQKNNFYIIDMDLKMGYISSYAYPINAYKLDEYPLEDWTPEAKKMFEGVKLLFYLKNNKK